MPSPRLVSWRTVRVANRCTYLALSWLIFAVISGVVLSVGTAFWFGCIVIANLWMAAGIVIRFVRPAKLTVAGSVKPLDDPARLRHARSPLTPEERAALAEYLGGDYG